MRIVKLFCGFRKTFARNNYVLYVNDSDFKIYLQITKNIKC